MPLHDTSFRKSAVSTKARKDRRFTRSGLRNIPNTQKSEKVRWGRGDLSGLFLLTTLSEPYLHGETAVKEICVRPMSIWWRRGELNSRPKTHPQELLRAQTVIAGVLLSPFPSPRASRHARGSGELHDAWHAQSLAYSRPPLNDA